MRRLCGPAVQPAGATCTAWTTCSAGSQTSRTAPTSSTDRQCSPCPANTYNNRPNKRCAPCVVGVSYFAEAQYRADGSCQFVNGLTFVNVKFRFTDAFPTSNSTLALFRNALLARLRSVLTGSRQNLEITDLQDGSIVVFLDVHKDTVFELRDLVETSAIDLDFNNRIYTEDPWSFEIVGPAKSSAAVSANSATCEVLSVPATATTDRVCTKKKSSANPIPIIVGVIAVCIILLLTVIIVVYRRRAANVTIEKPTVRFTNSGEEGTTSFSNPLYDTASPGGPAQGMQGGMLYEPVDDESFMADGHYDNVQFKSDGHYMDVAPVNKSETDAYLDVHVDEEDA